jgi:hypothetical protein
MFAGPVAPVTEPEMAHEMPAPARIPKSPAEFSGDTGGGMTGTVVVQ